MERLARSHTLDPNLNHDHPHLFRSKEAKGRFRERPLSEAIREQIPTSWSTVR
jgi:hypothetical protein